MFSTEDPQPSLAICANHATRLANLEAGQASLSDKLDRIVLLLVGTLGSSVTALLVLLLGHK